MDWLNGQFQNQFDCSRVERNLLHHDCQRRDGESDSNVFVAPRDVFWDSSLGQGSSPIRIWIRLLTVPQKWKQFILRLFCQRVEIGHQYKSQKYHQINSKILQKHLSWNQFRGFLWVPVPDCLPPSRLPWSRYRVRQLRQWKSVLAGVKIRNRGRVKRISRILGQTVRGRDDPEDTSEIARLRCQHRC